MIRLAYLVSHPIQYQAPLLRKIAREPGIDLTVMFLSDLSTRPFRDPGFGQDIAWDVPLLDGYRYEFVTDPAERLAAGRFDALWVHGYNHLANVRAIFAARRLGIKVLLRGESTAISADRGPFRSWMKELLLRPLFARCDAFMSIGSLNRDYYRTYGVPDDRIFHMPYSVDNEFFQRRTTEASELRPKFRASLGLEEGRPIILYAAKLIARKHPMDLLEAYVRLSPGGGKEPLPYLIFVGSGEEQKRLEARAAKTEWSSIRFLGFRNQTELPSFYDLCDVFVLPSTFEPWGLAVNEAMNARKPVIVSDQVGCAPDLVSGGSNGFVFPARDISALAEALREVTDNPERAAEMGARSVERIDSWNFEEDLAGLRTALGLFTPVKHEEHTVRR